MYRIGVIGGGAAGMMAAVTAAEHGAQVTILEHTDRLGRKILSTGNGKCNYTNLHISKDDYFGNHPSFVTDALSVFGPQDMISYFKDHGILTQEKRDGYCYPYAGQASTIRDFFIRRLEELSVAVLLQTKVNKIRVLSDGFALQTAEKEYFFDRLIIACGGKAAPVTGSDGSIFSLLKLLGIKLQKMYPTLAPLYVSDEECKLLAGVRANGSVTLRIDGEPACQDEGEIQFNKETISGIPVFQLTHDAVAALDEEKKVTIWVDFLPKMEHDETKCYIEKQIEERTGISTGQLLAGMVHQKVTVAILHRLKLPGSGAAGTLSSKQIKKIVSLLHHFVFTVSRQPDFANAQATRGGVCVDQLDQNMMVKKIPGLYIAGEMMDVDGKCGGYNLQWAWTSGRIAGMCAAAGENNA